ncbi:MAG: hypothetical protein IJJ47_11550 [Methanosphaera sp.]|nr:hypothetical protein [Methanosphaera sp.]
MINNNYKKILLLLGICFLLIGIVSAVSATDNVTKTKKEVKVSNNIDTSSKAVTKNDVSKKIVTKSKDVNNNVKTATKKKTPKISVKLNSSKALLNDRITIKTTLKTDNNKAIKNQKIIVKIGSKKYNIKTNSKGTAKLNFKVTSSNLLGKNITVKYPGNSKYKATTVKKLLRSNELGLYKKQMKKIGKRLKTLDKTLSAYDKKLKAIEKKYENNSKAIKSLFTKVNGTVKKLDDTVIQANKTLAKADKLLTKLDNSITSLEKKIDDAITKTNTFVNKTKDLKKYLTNNVRKKVLDLNVKELKNVKNLLKEKRTSLQNLKKVIHQKISESSSNTIQEISKDKIKELKTKIIVLVNEIDALANKYPNVYEGVSKYLNFL